MGLLFWMLQVSLITVLTNAGSVTTPAVDFIPNSAAHTRKDGGEYMKSLREANTLDDNVSSETFTDEDRLFSVLSLIQSARTGVASVRERCLNVMFWIHYLAGTTPKMMHDLAYVGVPRAKDNANRYEAYFKAKIQAAGKDAPERRAAETNAPHG
uniref:RxLR effector protein n=1 Tax=Peronospora matthiolae TaxID=2874970 RepID=A0AAV1UY38_9STRA